MKSTTGSISTSMRTSRMEVPDGNARLPLAELAAVTKLFSRTEQRTGSLKETLLSALKQRAQRDLVLALDDVSLTIRPGEALGVIGPNGAGKSTLLKVLAGISEPTFGTVRTPPRVLGLIELGAGFHPDLTGEENIRLQGALYGLTAQEIEARLDSILAFADLVGFRHLPVRHYSSGMFVRLGFAIAIHVAPDLLLVDEVLAVGDLEFQAACLREIEKLRARGTALVIVTHFPEQTEALCDRVLWLEAGRIRMLDAPGPVLAAWQADLIARRHATSLGAHTAETVREGLPGRFGVGGARIEAVRLLDKTDAPRATFHPDEPLVLEIDYTAAADLETFDCAVVLTTEDGLCVFYDRPAPLGCAPRRPDTSSTSPWSGTLRLSYPTLPLTPGRYGLTIALSPPDDVFHHYDMLYKLIHFSIVSADPVEHTGSLGALRLSGAIKVHPISGT